MDEADAWTGRAPLHYAAVADDAARVEALISAGAPPSFADRNGFTALHLAAQQGAFAACVALLDAGADVDLPNAYGNTALFIAVLNIRGREDIIQLLRERGADPLRSNDAGQSPVGLARLIGNYEVAQLFADVP